MRVCVWTAFLAGVLSCRDDSVPEDLKWNHEDERNSWCDFELDSCGWREMVPGDGFEWVWGSASEASTNLLEQTPARDRPTNTSGEGHFMFVLKNSSFLSQQALLRSPTFQPSSSDCIMTFWHLNTGQSVGATEMHLHVEGSSNVTVLWRTLYDQGNQWHPVVVQLGRQTGRFWLVFAKLSLGVYEGLSALDDVMFRNCSLPEAEKKCLTPDQHHCGLTKRCVGSSRICDLTDDCGDGTDEESCSPDLTCDFEEGLCSWTQDQEDDAFDWTRLRGPTPTANTGPWKDHTRGNVDGHYLYIESSDPQKFKDNAVLVSRPFLPSLRTRPENQPPCAFRFHYHMFGQNVLRLAVYIRFRSSGRGTLLWARYGDQGNFWHRKVLQVHSARHFQILVEGTVGDDFAGDIAIDDLSFFGCRPYEGELSSTHPSTSAPGASSSSLPPHSCSSEQFVCTTTRECVSLSQVCDFTVDCGDSSDEDTCVKQYCDFEGDSLCGWYLRDSAAPLQAFVWQTGQGESICPGEQSHRPDDDHTLASPQGWYLFADSSNGRFGEATDLWTPRIRITGQQCTLVFWYHMNGFTVGTLQVFIKSGAFMHEVWSQSGSQGNRWRRGEVFIGIRHNIQVVLRAKRGISYMGDVVVDDVAFTDCSPPKVSDRPCESNEFICSNAHCISEDNVCDFIDHCGDGSDENHYICKGFSGRCDFEFDLCSWSQSPYDDFDWLIKQGNTQSFGNGPSTDHTLRNPSGHYLYLKGSFPQKTGHTAQILSPRFSHSSQACKMVFYLHMSGEGIGTLSAYMMTDSGRSVLLNLTGNQGNYWSRQEVPLSSSENFHVVLEGKVGCNTRVGICLDDVIFSSGCLLSNALSPVSLAGACPDALQCGSGGCYKPEQMCDFTDDCQDGTDEVDCGTSCSFEQGRCGWNSGLSDTFTWDVGVGSEHMIRPPHDHTLGNESGHFVYLRASPVGLKGDKAHMKSAVWKQSSATCKLSFWYYISQKATGILRLFIKTEDGLREAWTQREMLPEWRRAEVSLKKLRNFILIFEVVRSRDVSAGAALDDLEFHHCAPRSARPGLCPALTDFVCKNGDCVEYHVECDGKADCSDESDEIDCISVPGTCSFDLPVKLWEEACQLSQDLHDDFDWSIGFTRGLDGTGPAADHSGRGGFLFVNSSAQQEGDVARLITKLEFPASMGICRMRFWFHMYGSGRMRALKVYTVGRSGTPLLMWATCGDQGDRWLYANVILSSPSPFRVSVQAEAGADQWTDIAVDDLSFTRECVAGAPLTPSPHTCHAQHFQCRHDFECLPQSWRCDGEVDCADGSDEETCASQLPGSPPPQTGCEDGEFLCSSNVCVPSLLRCDSVSDCPGGDDEHGCPDTQCVGGDLVCDGTSACVSFLSRCDQIVDCFPFQSDESSCYACPAGYCLHGGRCVIKPNGPVCVCSSTWTGNRCHVQASTSPDSAVDGLMVLSVGLTVLLILLLAASATILFVYCKRSSCAFRKPLKLIDHKELDTSTFDVPRQCRSPAVGPKRPFLNISVFPWRDNPTEATRSFSNPLYNGSSSSEA